MGFENANGEDVTNNEHLAEAINLTREGSAPPDGTTGYDEVQNPGDDVVQTLRDSCFYSAIEALQRIDSAPAESQKEIEEVMELLRRSWNGSVDEQARSMAEAHQRLQAIWVPPSDD